MVGGVAGVGLIIGAALLFVRRRNKSRKNQNLMELDNSGGKSYMRDMSKPDDPNKPYPAHEHEPLQMNELDATGSYHAELHGDTAEAELE